MRSYAAIGSALAVFALTSAASAADMPARSYTKAPPLVQIYNWTGFYAGVNAGGGWTTSGNASGFVGGAQIGYNWQTPGSPLVLGIEGDFQGTSIRRSSNIGAYTAEAKVPAFGTIRGRIGFAFDRTLIYGTGGWAFSDTKASLSGPGGSISDSKWGSGYTLGGGMEYAFAGPWTAKLEYLYVHAPSVDLTLAGVGVSTGDYNYNVVRAGLNYRF